MKKVTIIGMGLGESTITTEAKEAVARADAALGAPRALELCKGMAKRLYPCYLPEDVAAVVENEDGQEFAVLVSGDVGFYSAAQGLVEALSAYDLRFIPGVSTVSAFFARLKLPWQNAAFISAHGREMNVVDTVRRNRLTFCLTGNNINDICAALCKAGFADIKVHIGENLGADQERTYEATVDDLTRGEFPSLTVMLFVNEVYDDRTPFGLTDTSFSRLPGIPMTKSETRAIILSGLNLRPDSVCWDIGAGTGSVTVEMALNAYRGHVYAVERREDAIPLIEQNLKAFHVGNVTLLRGEAPVVLKALPIPDAVFIGGSGGKLNEIVAAVLHKNPDARIIVAAVTLETVSAALSVFAGFGLTPEVVQLNVARAKQAGSLHLMEAQNPVTILSAGGKP